MRTTVLASHETGSGCAIPRAVKRSKANPFMKLIIVAADGRVLFTSEAISPLDVLNHRRMASIMRWVNRFLVMGSAIEQGIVVIEGPNNG